ncbi:BLUF domain-containing protein [Spongiimicrobium salis]|uniref:BLUF domain-containing protein n=1 Tax=Spongiimicrobium salis TaxID=1667022 RepID=UPI00374CF90C
MFNLVYKSKVNPIFGQTQIQDMLEKARVYNTKNGISGCLLFYKGEFLQYLEGKEAMVLELFEKIKMDERHSDIQLLSQSFIYHREFDHWSMAYENFLGANHQLEYLKILISSFIDTSQEGIDPNPSTKSFWVSAKKLLKSRKDGIESKKIK